MEPLTIGIIGIVFTVVLLFMGMPVAFALGFVGFTGMFFLAGSAPALGYLASMPFQMVYTSAFIVFPLFVLMGEFVAMGEMHIAAFRVARLWLGRLPGGLAVASCGACALFGAASGSSIATTATIGRLAIEEMRKYGYKGGFAAGTVAMAGTLDSTIPPSGIMVIYAFLAEVSLGKLFIAGYIPGLLTAILYGLVIILRVKWRPELAPTFKGKINLTERLSSLRSLWSLTIIALIVLVGIYTGFTTATEAAAVAAAVALVIALAGRKVTTSTFMGSLYRTAQTTAMVFTLLIGGSLFARFLTFVGLSTAMVNFIQSLNIPPLGIIIVMLLILTVMGCFFEAISMLFVTMPFFIPIVSALGFDLIWFGLIVVMMAELAVVTPPIGVHLYVVKLVASDVPLVDIIRGSLPLMLTHLTMIGLLVSFPSIVLWLPNRMLGP